MLVSSNWIKDFTALPEMDSADMGVKFTMATCEVEEVTTTGAHLAKTIAAKVIAKEQHPEADKLSLVTINTGSEETTVVCGAPNVEVGMIAPYAPLGTSFPGGFTLVPKKIRGIESCGMLCAEDELGLGDSHDGIMSLPADTALGTPMTALFEVSCDTIIDIDNKSITHRPDLWGHYGMAREFALVFGTELKNPYNDQWKSAMLAKIGTGASPIVPRIEGDTCCKAYYGLAVDGVKVEASPQWMQDRLSACGLRPINNIVDISNFVMLELGMPNHIFDRELIGGGEIVIRPAGDQTSFTTLDEVERTLLTTDTVVADAANPLVIAGIMGGASSGVNDATTKVFIESANWIDAEVRKTSTRIGLRTDSSQRYEKSLDSQLLERSLLRIVELITELCPGATVVGSIEKCGDDLDAPAPTVIEIKASTICTTLGKEIEQAEIVRILEGLDFTVATNGDDLTVTAPTYRATKDVEVAADIVEEIGRIIGYDNITPEPTMERTRPMRLNNRKQLHRKIQDFMVYTGGLLETMTYPMIGEALLKKAQWPVLNEELQLVNALSKDHDRMRPSVIPSVLEAAAKNTKNSERFGFFEIGRSYQVNKKSFSTEHNTLTVALFDRSGSRFVEMVNLLESLIRHLNLPAQISKVNPKHPSFIIDRSWAGLHPGETLDIKVMGRNFGTISTLHPTVASKFKIKGNLCFLALDLSAFEDVKGKEKVNYKPLPKFPSSTFDCTVVASTKQEVADLVTVMNKLKLKNLEAAKVVDIFKLSDDEKAVTLRATFLDRENTLNHEFLEDAQNKIVAGLAKAGFPLKA